MVTPAQHTIEHTLAEKITQGAVKARTPPLLLAILLVGTSDPSLNDFSMITGLDSVHLATGIRLAAYTGAMALILMAGTRTWHSIPRAAWAIVAIAFMSAPLSIAPMAALASTLKLALTLLAVAAVARFMDLKQVATTVGLSILALVIVSVPVWQETVYREPSGIFSTRNELARAGIMLFLAGLVLVSRRERKILGAGFAGVGAYVVVATESATSILAVAGLCGAFVIAETSRRVRLHQATRLLIPALILAGAGVAALWPAVLEMFGRDATLTGRTEIWSAVLNAIGARPFVGHGYGAYWNSPLGEGTRWELGPQVVNAHNGYLEQILDFGVLGGVVVIAITISIAIGRARVEDAGFAALASMAVLFIYSITESGLIRPMYFTSIVLLAFASCGTSATLGDKESARQ